MLKKKINCRNSQSINQSINQSIYLRHMKQKITMNDENEKQCVNKTQRQQKAALIGAITQHYGNKLVYKTNHYSLK